MKKINLIWQTRIGDETDFAYEYITEVLFKNFEINNVLDYGNLSEVLNNSVIVYSNNSGGISESFNEYIDKFVNNGYSFYLLHLSDESLVHDCSYYKKASHVFRTYYSEKYQTGNTTFIPLGFKTGFLNRNKNYRELTDKKYNFSFIGQTKSDREELILVLDNIKNVFIHKTYKWLCPTSLSETECSSIYSETKFVPCPMGFENPDSFRIMESLESGSIPILKNYNGLDYINKVWGETPLPVVNSWIECVNMLTVDYSSLYNKVFDWYEEFKSDLPIKIEQIISQTYSSNEKSNKIEHFYKNIESEVWFDFDDLYSEMVNRFDNGHFVEIGVWKGMSACYMATEIINSEKNIKFDCVDTWEYVSTSSEIEKNKFENLFNIFLRNIEPVKESINIVKSLSWDASLNYNDESLDFVFIDAGHDYISVKKDLHSWFPKIKVGGVIAGHDFHWGTGVYDAVTEFFGIENIRVDRSSWVVEKTERLIVNYSEIIENTTESIASHIEPLSEEPVKSDESLGFDIGITTFSLRFDFVEKLIKKIKELNVPNNIYLCINGEQNSNFNEDYRKRILNLCINTPNVFPIFFVETRGLSKMWNTLIIHSTEDNILILNDDIDLVTDNMFKVVSDHIKSEEYKGLSKINDTFSYFVINKELINELGYFDERLLGFGEEDGDITYRLLNKKGYDVYKLYAQGVYNIVSDIRHTHIKPGIGKYSLFNREFTFNQKYNCNNAKSNISGMFGVNCDQIMEDINLYPYEKFFIENKKNI